VTTDFQSGKAKIFLDYEEIYQSQIITFLLGNDNIYLWLLEIPHACSRIGNNSDASPKQPAEVLPACANGRQATSATEILSWGISVWILPKEETGFAFLHFENFVDTRIKN